MKKVLDYVTTIAFLAVCVVFLWKMLQPAAGMPRSGRPAPPVPQQPLSLDRTTTEGQPSARAAIIVFSDFQCPFCGQFARETVRRLEEEYVKPGKALLAFSHLPLERLHPRAFAASEAAACAAVQGQFWRMHEALFSDQDHLDDASMIQKATAANLDVTRFTACVTGHETRSLIGRDLASASALRVSVTPTVMIGLVQTDGRVRVVQVFTGYQSMDALRAVLDRLQTAAP